MYYRSYWRCVLRTLKEIFTDIANAIRAKTGKEDKIVAENFADEINSIDTNAKILTEIEGIYLSSASNQLVRYITNINEDLFLTSKNGAWLFYNMNNLQYVKSIDLTNANGTLGLKGLFSGCNKLKFSDIKIKGLDVSKVSDISNFFENCYQLTSEDLINVFDIYNWNTSNITKMDYLFSFCTGIKDVIDISNFDMSNVTSAHYMFKECSKVKKILFSKTTNKISYMYSLIGANAQNIEFALEELSEIYAGNVISIKTSGSNTLFWGTFNNFTTFGGFKDLGKAYIKTTTNYADYKLDLRKCPNLSHDSLMNVINKLYDLNLSYDVVNGGTLYTQTLQIGTTNLAKLTEEEIAIATSKGWNVT